MSRPGSQTRPWETHQGLLDGDEVLVCNTPNGDHIVPGGRRELDGLSQFAVLLLHQAGERPDDPSHTYPHPDCFMVVYRATAISRPSREWADTEGWETGSALYAIAEAMQLGLSPIDNELLRAAAARRSPS